MLHFHCRAWWPVSQVLDRRQVLLELFNQIQPQWCFSEGDLAIMTEEDLADKLRRSLKGRRYLIFLDDVWATEAWESLSGSFPDDSTQSRIILTSRYRNIAPDDMLDEEPHLLSPLDDDDSLELLQRKLFVGRGWPHTLLELGMQIVENCKGHPLTIVIAAGLLATVEQHRWKEISEALSSTTLSNTDQCMSTLELSYKHLPDYLKPCFLYFGAFPEDQEVLVRRLIWLWIAEGFVKKTKSGRVEDVAEVYMADLIQRNLVMVVKWRSIGVSGVKTCRIHDLLHSFCQRKAKEESFFHLLKGYDQLSDFNEPCYSRRLCIYSEPVQFKESKLFCPQTRSLVFISTKAIGRREIGLFDLSFIIHIFKLLKVLSIEQIPLEDGLPSEIEALLQLEYLSFQSRGEAIPLSIGNLCKLETLSAHMLAEEPTLPRTLWDLCNLKCLYMMTLSDKLLSKRDYLYRIGWRGGAILPIENLENSSILFQLETLSGAVFDSQVNFEKLIRKFPNIRRLKCIVSYQNFEKIVFPDFLGQLESLTVLGKPPSDDFRCELCLPGNLRKLTLSSLGLSRKGISILGKLPNLEVLKLRCGVLSVDVLEMEEGEFSKLTFLELSLLSIERWTAVDDQFPLQKLVLHWCHDLVEIPSCLENISTLTEIIVEGCSPEVDSSVSHIKEVQMEYGNQDIDITFNSTSDSSDEERPGVKFVVDEMWSMEAQLALTAMERAERKRGDFYAAFIKLFLSMLLPFRT